MANIFAKTLVIFNLNENLQGLLYSSSCELFRNKGGEEFLIQKPVMTRTGCYTMVILPDYRKHYSEQGTKNNECIKLVIDYLSEKHIAFILVEYDIDSSSIQHAQANRINYVHHD